MAQFEGVERFSLPPAELYPKLADCGFLAGCLPDAEVTEATPDRAAWKLRPKLSFLSGSLDSVLTVGTRTTPEGVTFTVSAKGIGATSTVLTALTLTPDGTGTAVRWTGELTALTGLLKMVPKGLIQATAQKVIGEVWASVRGKIEAMERG